MYRLIESYDDAETVSLAGSTFPATCLVEDEDGIRLLILPTMAETVRAHLWVQAHTQGAAALVRPFPGGYVWMLAERFMEERKETLDGQFTLPDNGRWKHVPDPPTYRSMRSAVTAIEVPQTPRRNDFVHLHAHSEFSPLDGLSKVKEMVDLAVADNQAALALTDHGVCAGHPDLMKHATAAGIKPIFGIEAYLVDDRFERPTPKPNAKDKAYAELAEQHGSQFAENQFQEDLQRWVNESGRIRNGYHHLILWAMNDAGLRNLWAMSTEANKDGFYYHPRMDWATLESLNEGVMASTACLRGPLAHPLKDHQDVDAAWVNLGRLQHIFGDRLYVELGTNELPEQIAINKALVELAHAAGVPLLAAVDSHYPCYEDQHVHKAWIAAQTNKDIQDEADLFAGAQDYHLMQGKEVRQYLSYLGESVVDEAMASTLAVAERCNAKVAGVTVTPIFSKAGTTDERIQRDRERSVDMCIGNWARKVVGKSNDETVYMQRFEHEASLLTKKGFWGYFLMVADYVRAAKDAGILVGPGRGSGGGSLVAYLMDITEIDPVEADLLFERFMTEGRTELPDFDIDFPSSKRDWIENYVAEKWGEDHVVRVGTHVRLKNKGVVRDLARVMKGQIDIFYPDIDAICKIIDEAESDTAGAGLKWDELWDQHGEALQPYRDAYPELFELAERMVGRLKAYGKHAAGVIINPDFPLTGSLPLRLSGEGEKRQLVADFEMVALMEVLGLIKFDLLTLRNLDTVQMCIDLVRERHGVQINVYDWKEEYEDPLVWDELSAGHTLGCFQIETKPMTDIVLRMKPRSVSDLADAITLVRPGPKRSGLTDTYFRRKNGEEPVSFPDPRLEQALAKTYGCIIYQEDIMQTCMRLAGYDGVQADKVRKILGKKKVEDVIAEGEKFVPACVRGGMAETPVVALWDQMKEFAKYSFNRAHAFGYAVLSHWTAWLKFHYPTEFMTALLSTEDKNNIPDCIIEARRLGIKVLPPDINVSGTGFAAVEEGLIRYGLDSVKTVGEAKCAGIMQGQPYSSWDDFKERAKADSGVVKTLARVGAFDSLVPNRRALEAQLEWETSEDATRCQRKDESVIGPNGLPCMFDWTSEPVELTKTGKEKKRKEPPKRCTRGCRQYLPPVKPDLANLANYDDAQIRDIETELLGVYLSSTPFDRIPEDVLREFAVGSDVMSGPLGDYKVAALVQKIKPYGGAKNGKEMGFIDLFAQDTKLDVTVFSDEWAKFKRDLWIGRLCFALVTKNDRGITLSHFHGL